MDCSKPCYEGFALFKTSGDLRMSDYLNVLVAEPDPETASAMEDMLSSAGHACTSTSDAAEALEHVQSGGYEVIVANVAMDGPESHDLIEAARRVEPECEVILVGNKSNPPLAARGMKRGALSYLVKPLNMAELDAEVSRAAEIISLRRDKRNLSQQLSKRYGLENIVGNSPQMLDIFEKIRQIAPTDATVLICGETGTGKELVARAIHHNSHRRNNRFVPVNCAGIVESILESELFGHEKGAFTNASSSRVGKFEYANHGTLFLDEVGDLASSSQSKLLRVLEHNEIVRVGANEPVQVDVRLVAATNQPLREQVKDGNFRRDLFYRLNVVTLNLPPLRKRQGDIMLLIDFFLRELSEQHERHIKGITPGVRAMLLRYHWPGNVRELRNCLAHMVVVTTDDMLGEDDLPDYILEESGKALEEPSLKSMAGQPLEEMEKEHIRATLELVDGNRQKAADLLDIGERTLYRKIQKYDLS